MDEPVVAVFDGVADVYDEVVPFFATFGRLIAAALPDPGPGARLLDVGAGAGAIALAARDRGYAVSAVDAAPGMVARLSRVVPDARLADAAALPFPDRVFDVATAGFVLHILTDPGAALREIRRVLKPGGLLAFTVVGPPPDGFAEADASAELFAEFSRYLPPGGSMGGAVRRASRAGRGRVPRRDRGASAGRAAVGRRRDDVAVVRHARHPQSSWRTFPGSVARSCGGGSSPT